MKVVFRVDVSAAIGTGHVMRCLALAGELRRQGSDCTFLVRNDGLGLFAQRIIQEGHELITLPQPELPIRTEEESPSHTQANWLAGGWRADVRACVSVLSDRPVADWLVVDHYGLDARWEGALRQMATRIFVIDDRADRSHDCDFLLDQNFVDGVSCRYTGLVPPRARLLMGPRYALLHPTFADRRANLRSRDGSVRRVLVCFGGADPQGHTVAAIEALRPHAGNLDRIDVVVGSISPHKDSVAAACANLPNAAVHCPAPDIATLLAAADLAIGAGGSMNWERACLGVPTIAFGIAENQRPVLASLIEAGYVAGIPEMVKPDAQLMRAWISPLLSSPQFLRGLSSRSATLVDGNGAGRVAQVLLQGTLAFRRATLEDSENLLLWRNDPAIRAVSLDDTQISRSTHEVWLRGVLADPHRVLLVAEFHDEPVGVVRFDLSPPEAVISAYRVPTAKSGRGLIRQATEWLRATYPGIRKITAEVLSTNRGSLAAFRNAGYRDAKNTLMIELDRP